MGGPFSARIREDDELVLKFSTCNVVISRFGYQYAVNAILVIAYFMYELSMAPAEVRLHCRSNCAHW